MNSFMLRIYGSGILLLVGAISLKTSSGSLFDIACTLAIVLVSMAALFFYQEDK